MHIRHNVEDHYDGFSLKSVGWGYREIFEKTIESLFNEGVIGSQHPEVTTSFFCMLKNADHSCSLFDHVLKTFLEALNPRTRWLVDMPGLFIDIVETGRELARTKTYYGICFFETMGDGGFGESPEEVRNLLSHVRRLRETDDKLAVAFIKGYGHLVKRLTPDEMQHYIRAGLDIFRRNSQNGLDFMEGTLRTSETYIVSITRECRLGDIQSMLAAMMQALVGYEVEINNLGALDTDELIMRNSSVVCMYEWLYVPIRIRDFDNAVLNRRWYLLTTIVAAGMIAEKSFCCVHGHPEYRTCADLIGHNPLALNLFQITEYARVLRRIRERWPGARHLIDFGLRTECERCPPNNPADRLFFDTSFNHASDDQAQNTVIEIADTSVNLFETAALLTEPYMARILSDYPGLDLCQLRTFSFLPDMLFPCAVSSPSQHNLVADLKQQSEKKNGSREDNSSDEMPSHFTTDGDGSFSEDDSEDVETAPACYLYDEWSQEENDYYRDYCCVHENKEFQTVTTSIPSKVYEEARRISHVFELLKPELARREKYLQEGDILNSDLLVEYLVQCRKEPSPKANFYEQPILKHRDLAVQILLDVSGSTGHRMPGGDSVIDIEKHAAIILGQGLNSLGDRFSVSGFSSEGREQCLYLVFKEFAEQWNRKSIERILSSRSSGSTRMGPAIRHSAYRLSQIDARQRLTILITDGKPMDRGYDHNTRYAQYDVRMACEEGSLLSTATFALSTEENTVADMELMFPNRRFAILSDIQKLPRVLPRLYTRLTL